MSIFLPSTKRGAGTCRWRAWVAMVLGLLGAGLAYAQSPQLDLPKARLSAGMHLIQAQVASTAAQRNTG
ncbi:MAG: DUF192 domain-containing protein, partial [Burkholderiaceae bacterium]